MGFLAGCVIAFLVYYFYQEERDKQDEIKSIVNQALAAELMQMNPDYKEMLSALLHGEDFIAEEAQRVINSTGTRLLSEAQRHVDFYAMGSPEVRLNKFGFLRERIQNALYPHFGCYWLPPSRHYFTIEELRDKLSAEIKVRREASIEFNRQYRKDKGLPPWD